ncbi:DUF5995 family protein [Terrimonas sp. NA20]|uniref:DUF5995 family protein n=1 Tax=Terrimonas ginsenosidimutans TaxID=2908004 RepID=A0ABS9KRV1_9BACT|nr:DUF5995 family protein [Terrimonas ginsenosidimutans]MCG2615057.1 DUF5995 family protein [Terrimonas ginsenosidimutans]
MSYDVTNKLPVLTAPLRPIDEVIGRMEKLIENCIHNQSRLGYFASLYHKVTVRVREGIDNNEFEDNERMEKFDVLFASRYLDAMDAIEKGGRITGSWQVAIDSSRKPSVVILQHLLMGMNAHINLDLGIAAAEVTRDADIQQIRKDFNTINSILGSLVFEILNQLNKVSPLLSLFGLSANNDSLLIQFSLVNARDGAWNFAEDLHLKKADEFHACIAARDETISKLGASLVTSKGFLLRVTRWVVWLFEWKRPAKVIAVLFHSEKKYVTESNGKLIATAKSKPS